MLRKLLKKPGPLSPYRLTMLFMLLTIAVSSHAATDQGTKTVLLLHSYHAGLSWTDDITSSIKESFEGSDQKIALYVEYLDTKRNRKPEYISSYLDEFMTYKLESLNFDLVIVSDNDAFNFALKHRNDLFSGIPIIFCGVNGFKPSQIEGITQITGVAETPDLSSTIKLIQTLHPATTELIVIGTTKDPTGQRNYEHFRKIEPAFKNLQFTYLNDLVMEDLLKQVSNFKPGQVVFTSPTIKDKQGRFYAFAEATALLRKSCSVPIYGGWDMLLGHGIVGGKLISGSAQGKETARMAIAVLGGVIPATIPVVSSLGSQYMFDYNELQSHKIDLDLLPESSRIINAPVSFYSINIKLFWASLALAMVFVLFSSWLLVMIRHAKKLEHRLRESEVRFKDIALSIGDWIWEVDSNGAYRYCSDKVCDLLGYTVEEILGKTPFEFMDPDSAETAKQFMAENINKCRPFWDFENWNIHKDGSRICLLTSGTPILNTAGEVIGYRGVDKDITKQKAAEAELSQRRAEFETIFNSISDAIVFVDPQRQIQRINPAFIHTFGYQPEEVIGQTTRLIYAGPDDYNTLGKKHFNPQTSTKSSLFENKYRRKNGSIFTGETLGTHVCDKNGDLLGYLGVIRDISQRKEAEQERMLLLSAIEQAAETIVITDKKGNIQYTNPAFEKISGFSCAEGLGQNPRILKSGEQDEAFYKKLWNTITQGEIWNGRLINKRANGEIYTEDATISPVLNATGEVGNFIAVKRDITAELELEKQMMQGQKLEIIGTLASGIAHDFNNILAPILGYSQLMIEKKNLDQEDLERQKVILTSATRAKDLVEQILDFSRHADDIHQPLQLKLQIEETLNLLRATTPTKIEFSLDLQDLQILAPSAKVHQLILNLCTNAAQAMHKTGGQIALKLKKANLKPDNLLRLPPGDYAHLTIQDNGPGIAPEILPQIFNPYFTTKEVGEGSGIGLATVQRIISNLDGIIKVESSLGHGTRFHIILPASQVEEPVNKSKAKSAPPPQGKQHILLVDDEDYLVSLTSEFLQNLGYTVTGFTRSHDAIRAFEEQPDKFDLLLTDLTMPQIDGLQLARRASKINPELPVILCTGQLSPLTDQELENINLLKILKKPDILTDLAFTLHQYFSN